MPPNIIMIMTDQQRYDSIAALGYPYMQTPALDRLAEGGVCLTNMFCAAPSCVPSRASLFTAQYPHSIGVYHNANQWRPSWVQDFQAAGYHTVNIGKFHSVPFDDPGGFDQRFVVENKDRPLKLHQAHGGFYDEWDRFLNNSGVEKPSREDYRDNYQGYDKALGAYEWPLDEEYHPDVFVGTMAKWFLKQRQSESPLFMVLGFPGPHPPYDPPQRLIDAYESSEIPIPDVSQAELDAQPPPHAAYRQVMIDENHDAVRWQEKPDAEDLQRLRQYYAANVTLIDEQIGQVIDVLNERGYLDDAIVVFTSDHGDCLGDHGHIQKWTMYDEVTRVPTIIWGPRYFPEGSKSHALLQQFDLVPTLMDLAGIEPIEQSPAMSVLSVIRGEQSGRDVVYAEHSADNILREVEFVTMIRSETHKLVHYAGQPWGELYDLIADPQELVNLWEHPEHHEIKTKLLNQLLEWRILPQS